MNTHGRAGTAPEAANATLVALFEEQAARTPAATAVVGESERVTYAELNERTNRLAHLLVREGIGPESLVGLAIPRSLDAIVALIAILKAGAAYVPLDPDYPDERLRFMLHDAGAPGVLMTAAVELTVPDGIRRIVLDAPAVRDLIAASRSSNPDVAIDPDHAAYCIYTSGSTGAPKGVLMPHRAIANKIRTLIDYLGVDQSTRFAVTSSISFDPLLDQVFLPLCAGGAAVVVPDEVRDDPSRFAAYAARCGISILNGTPGLVERLLCDSPVRVDTLVIGADLLQSALANELRSRGAARRILNFYGPTETCINASGYDIGGSCPPGSVPIGSALPTYRLYVLDPTQQPVAAGVTGELHIGGPGVARGYLRRPALTAERFLPDRFGAPGDRMYRTGDLVRWRFDGTLEFLGRVDGQVKVRGFRVEPGEIEHALAAHPDVARAIVVPQAEPSGEQRLAAYVVPREGAAPAAGDLRAFLHRTLPPYMVPSAFVSIDRFPLTPNGKIDRAALPAAGPPERSVPMRVDAEPASETEQAIAAVFEEVLGVERITPADNFFDLGGHSLSAMRVVSRLRDRLHVNVPLRLVFDAASLGTLAERIDELRVR